MRSPAAAAESGPYSFQTTHWSLVIAAGDRGGEQSKEALARLCSDYWRPLYFYVRRCGNVTHAAEDLTQAFFARLLEKEYLRAANRERGRFRSFLLASLKHFLANQQKAERAQKRGGGKQVLALDFAAAESAYNVEPAGAQSPERLFERQWALVLLERVLLQLEQECAEAGKQQQFARLRDLLTAGPDHQPYRDVAKDLAISEAAVKMAVHRLRKRYRELLRQEISQTVSDPAEIDDELRQLFTVLAKESA